MRFLLQPLKRWYVMRTTQRTFAFPKLIVVIMMTLMLVPVSARAATKYKVLYAFKGGSDGNYPSGALVLDAAGNLYGTTIAGGGDQENCTGEEPGCGTVFMLAPISQGKWKERVLHRFESGNDTSDGSAPNGALVFDNAGNLYGTTTSGGGSDEQCSSGAFKGCGIVFELSPKAHGGWPEMVLYRFQINAGGAGPNGGLVFDNTGNLYGTAAAAGNCCDPIFDWGAGVVFQLTPGSGGWSENVLHSFCARKNCSDGNAPYSGLLRTSDGALYGTTEFGGGDFFPCFNLGCGTLFKLTENSKGKWSEQVLNDFIGRDGIQPFNSLTADKAGNLYGTTSVEGAFGDGTVFKLVPAKDGRWTFNVIYNFDIDYAGSGSYSTGVVFDKAGNLYGTVWGPESGNCAGGGCGLVYKLEPRPKGPWKYSVIYAFQGGQDGGDPTGTLIVDQNGNLYGTAGYGGAGGHGVVFEITP
jgi:uncharacterized repeat protein (TIGR03803 family)